MKYSPTYQGIIWTHHALKRLADRKIPQEYAWRAFTFPDRSKKGNAAHSTEFIKQINTHTVSVIAKQNDHKQWLILSAWITPPIPGSIDHIKTKTHSSILSWLVRIVVRLFKHT